MNGQLYQRQQTDRVDKDRKLAGVRWRWIDDNADTGVWFQLSDVWNKPID